MRPYWSLRATMRTSTSRSPAATGSCQRAVLGTWTARYGFGKGRSTPLPLGVRHLDERLYVPIEHVGFTAAGGSGTTTLVRQ